MPTPFYHLQIGETLLHHQALSPAVRRFLAGQRSAFLFGNTAPDVQVISGQERQATHFFTLPIRPDSQLAWERMLATYPSLAQPASLPGAQAAFLAGYLCHLQADWLWIRDIFLPTFGPTRPWGTFPQRLYLHNVLRAYLDLRVLPDLPPETGQRLGEVRVEGWLPFTQDGYLSEWRDFLAGQLQPGAGARTVEVFAARQGLSPQEFLQLLESEQRMDEEVFSHLRRSQLAAYRQRLIEWNLQLLPAFLSGAKTRSERALGDPPPRPGFLEEKAAP